VPPADDRIGRAEAEAAAKQERAENPPPLSLLQLVAIVEAGERDPDALLPGLTVTLRELAVEAAGELTASEQGSARTRRISVPGDVLSLGSFTRIAPRIATRRPARV
jgi:hypothetical protein